MLRKEDCKPGVEVIAIKNNAIGLFDIRPDLKIGSIYTIATFHDKWIVDHKVVDQGVVALNEFPKTMGISWGYTLDQFKLRRPEEFTELFQTSDEQLKKFRDVEEYV